MPLAAPVTSAMPLGDRAVRLEDYWTPGEDEESEERGVAPKLRLEDQ